MKATYIRDLPKWNSDARLYKLDQPAQFGGDDGEVVRFTHVAVSAIHVGQIPETFVFAADTSGKVISWSELPGSFRGALHHDRALRGFLDLATPASK